MSEELLGGDGQGPYPSSGGVEDGVDDGWCDAHDGDLADALDSDGVRRVRLTAEDHVDVGDVGIDGDKVVAERGIGDAPGGRVGQGLLQQGHADSAIGPADDLAGSGLLVEDAAAVDRGDYTGDPDQPEIGVDLDLGELGGEDAGLGV